MALKDNIPDVANWSRDGEGDVHVMPSFGRPHVESKDCWCRPQEEPETRDRRKYIVSVWVHGLEH